MELQHAWLALAVTAVAVFIAFRTGASEPTIRLTGMLLQLLGVGTVAWGVAQTRSQFGHASLWSLFRSWVRRFPPFRPKTIIGYASGVMPGFTGHAYGTVSPAPLQNPTMEERVALLEAHEKELRQGLRQHEQRLEQHVRQAAAALADEASARERVVQDILRRLETTATGGIHITAIGAVWLFAGVILGTGSGEIANLLK